jgi:hypothetical protein
MQHDLARVVTDPGGHDHFVQLYEEPEALAGAVAEYIGAGLARGEGAVIIARPENRTRFVATLERRGLAAGEMIEAGQLKLFDAAATLERFMANGAPAWTSFHELIGGVIADLRLQYPTVRAYGEMVDILWQAGNREGAIRLEEYWNELGKLQTFSLFCAYRLSHLDADESICRVHTHLVPSREHAGFDEEVKAASCRILDQPLADVLLSLAENHRPPTRMSSGHATLFWLRQNMPRTAEKVLSELRGRAAPAG